MEIKEREGRERKGSPTPFSSLPIPSKGRGKGRFFFPFLSSFLFLLSFPFSVSSLSSPCLAKEKITQYKIRKGQKRRKGGVNLFFSYFIFDVVGKRKGPKFYHKSEQSPSAISYRKWGNLRNPWIPYGIAKNLGESRAIYRRLRIPHSEP